MQFRFFFVVFFGGWGGDGDTEYSKTCVKWPLKNRQNKDLNDKL